MPVATRLSLPAFPLLSHTTLEQWLRIGDDVDVATIDLLLASAVDYIEGQTGRVLVSADYAVTVINPQSFNRLGLSPVNGVSSVTVTAGDGTVQTLAPGADYLALLSGGEASISVANLPADALVITVTCNAGYQSQAAVPASLQQAAAVLVAAGYDNRSALDPRTVATVSNLITRYRAVGV